MFLGQVDNLWHIYSGERRVDSVSGAFGRSGVASCVDFDHVHGRTTTVGSVSLSFLFAQVGIREYWLHRVYWPLDLG